MRIALVTDSTGNLDQDLAVRHGIHVAPLYVIWEDQTYRDRIDLPEDEFYRRLRNANSLPKTSQVSIQDFVDIFQRAREEAEADAVICQVLSSELSGTYASAIQAKQQVDFPVHVIDTRQVSWALGFPVLEAAVARDNKLPFDAVLQTAQKATQRVRLFFTIESLDFLHRGGRIGNATRLLGTALSIKPILTVEKGLVDTYDKVRTRKRAVERLVTAAEECGEGRPVKRLAVIHGDAQEEAETVLDMATSKLNPSETYLSYATTVLGVHVGPGALGLIAQWGE